MPNENLEYYLVDNQTLTTYYYKNKNWWKHTDIGLTSADKDIKVKASEVKGITDFKTAIDCWLNNIKCK